MGSLVVESPDRAAGEVRVRKTEAGRVPCSSLYTQLIQPNETNQDKGSVTGLIMLTSLLS